MKKAFFTIADNNNLQYYEMLKNSLNKFHPDIPLILIGEEQMRGYQDMDFFYRATPIIASQLLQEYDAVCKLDADQIITGNLDHIWEDEYDVAVVNNSNPREDAKYPIRFMDIHPLSYINCGFVVIKSKTFVNHWLTLCKSTHFPNFQYREQDLLNIMVFYMSELFGGTYKVKFLDASDKWHGLVHKGFWSQIELKGDELVLPANDEWNKEDQKIVAIHWAGGNLPDKMKYKLHFKDEVCKRLDELVKS